MNIRIIQDGQTSVCITIAKGSFFEIDYTNDADPLLAWLSAQLDSDSDSTLAAILDLQMRQLEVGDVVELTTDEQWFVRGPDGLNTTPAPFASKDEADASVPRFVQSYREQGYYLTSDRERIPVAELACHLQVHRAVAPEAFRYERTDAGWRLRVA